MPTIVVDVNDDAFLKGLQNADSKVRVASRKSLKEAGQVLVVASREELKGHFNVSSGNAERSIQVTESTDVSVTVGINESVAPYAVYLHEGTKDHKVEPKDKKALAWVSGGQSFFSKGHIVTGIQKYQFIYEASKKKKDTIVKMIQTNIVKALREAGL